MADFPVTLNGVTWNSSDFTDGKYYRNLFNFLDSAYDESSRSNNCYVTTSMTIGAGDKTIVLPTVKPYAVGQRLRVVPATDMTTSNYSLGYMEGFVVSYNTGTGSLVFRPLIYQGSATVDKWHISPGGEPVVSTAPLTLAQGGVGAVGESAYPYLGLKPVTTSAEFFEDFTGSFGASSSRNGQGVGFVTATTGSAKVYLEGNAKAAESLNYSAQAINGDHPGIAVLEATEAGNTAELNLGNCSACLHNGGMLRVMFFLDYTNSGADKTYMQIGLRYYNGTEFQPGLALEYPRNNGVDVAACMFDNFPYVSTAPLEPGNWYEIRIYTGNGVAGDVVQAKLFKLTQFGLVLVQTFGDYPIPPPDAVLAVMPFIRLKKLYGRRASRLWVDYLHFNPTISR